VTPRTFSAPLCCEQEVLVGHTFAGKTKQPRTGGTKRGQIRRDLTPSFRLKPGKRSSGLGLLKVDHRNFLGYDLRRLASFRLEYLAVAGERNLVTTWKQKGIARARRRRYRDALFGGGNRGVATSRPEDRQPACCAGTEAHDRAKDPYRCRQSVGKRKGA